MAPLTANKFRFRFPHLVGKGKRGGEHVRHMSGDEMSRFCYEVAWRSNRLTEDLQQSKVGLLQQVCNRSILDVDFNLKGSEIATRDHTFNFHLQTLLRGSIYTSMIHKYLLAIYPTSRPTKNSILDCTVNHSNTDAVHSMSRHVQHCFFLELDTCLVCTPAPSPPEK